MKRIPSLDGLRAISISLVVLGHWVELRYHSDVAGAFANLGVRIFFIISGYLITSLLLREHAQTSTIALSEFYKRRAYRILPASIVFMAVVFLVFWQQTSWYHMLAAALYLANFDFTHPWFLGHLWSLSVEEQFYFLWPGVLSRWFRRRGLILAGVVAFAPLYRVSCHFLGLHGRADETFPAVADILAFGCLLAIYADRIPKIRTVWAALMILPVALVPIYLGTFALSSNPGSSVCTLACDACLDCGTSVACGADALSIPERATSGVAGANQLQPLFVAAAICIRNSEARPWYLMFVAVGFACGSYYFIEQPVLRFRRKVARKQEWKRYSCLPSDLEKTEIFKGQRLLR